MSDEYITKLCLWGELTKALDLINSGVYDCKPPQWMLARLGEACQAVQDYYGPGCICRAYYDMYNKEFTYRFRMIGGVA